VKAIPQSQLMRTGVVGSTAMKIGLGKLKTKAKRKFLSDEDQAAVQEKQEDAEAEILFKAMTQLRGTAVKLAQLLGMETDLIPPKIQRELSKSYHQVPPLNRVLVNKVVQQSLGKRQVSARCIAQNLMMGHWWPSRFSIQAFILPLRVILNS